jgi:hypothetical protein
VSAWSFLVLEVSVARHRRERLMKSRLVAETSVLAMSVRHGGSGKQSAQDRSVCRLI